MAMSSAVRAVALFCIISFAIADAATTVVVVKDLARVLLLPYGDSKLIGLAKKGDEFKVVSKKNDWYNIEFRNTIGWIFQDNIRIEVKSETAAAAPVASPAPKPVIQPVPPPPSAPPSPAPVPLPAPKPPQNLPELKKPFERPEPSAERIEARLKRSPAKQKKQQSFSIDLPPVPVTPAEVEKEKTLPVAQETTATPPAVQPSPAPEPAPKTPAARRPNVANLPEVKPVPPGQGVDTATRTPPLAEEGTEVNKYFEILDNSVKVLASVSPESPIIGNARKNECFVLLFEGQSWCKIRFGNSEGWVERRSGRPVDSPTMAGNVNRIIFFGAIGLGVIILVALVVIFLVISLRTKGARKIAVRKDLLIIAHSEKEVQLSLTDSTTSLSKCFSEIGFKVSYASDLDHAKNMLMHYLPDVIVADWHIGHNIMQAMESVLANRSSTTNILVIFYNVPDVQSIPQSKLIPNAHFLGISFSDRDVFKLVTPLIITQSETKSIRRSVESSALGGEIGHGSLIEVMQFIEIGRKTGCLYIVIEKPFGLIYFEQGRLTYAASQAKQGRDAVFEILGLKSGHFHFVLDKVSQTKNVNFSTLEILMEWTKTVDEAHRA
jgi:hypothetical protein